MQEMRMNLNDQVVNLELSKRLAEMGIKKMSLFYWHNDGKEYYPSYGDPQYCLCGANYSAFTVIELLEILPIGEDDFYGIYITKGDSKYFVSYNNNIGENEEFTDYNLANALASMLITLIESGIIKND